MEVSVSLLEITHVRDRLLRDFTGRIPLSNSGTPEERERNFLTRALAAFAIHKIAGATLDEAAGAVVDGGGDGGLDAIYYSPLSHRLWLVQSKFFAGGQGEPGLGDVSKYRDGIEALLRGDFQAFAANAEITRRVPALQAHLDDRALQVRGVLIYSGIQTVSEDRIRIFEQLRRRFSPDNDYLAFQRFNLTSVHDWLTGADHIPGVDIDEITLYRPGYLPGPYETYYGLVRLADLAALQAAYGPELVAANIRNYKGSTEVNEQIAFTIRETPEHFFYLNNGLTAYCSRIEPDNRDRGNTEKKSLRVYGFSVVNGAQTLGAVGSFPDPRPEPFPEGYVFIKIISLATCPDERTFAQLITRSTNYQNQVGLRDFVALDSEQERIRSHLELSGIFYHYKESENDPAPDETNFILVEATTSLACLEQDLDFCTRALANRRSLWSQEIAFPGTEFNTRYRRLFRPDRTATTIWRAVQAQREVVRRCQENGRASTGKRKAFFENARWLILHIVFIRLHPERRVPLALTVDEIADIRRDVDEVAEALWTAAEPLGQHRHFKTIFSNADDCRRMKGSAMTRLAAVVPGP